MLPWGLIVPALLLSLLVLAAVLIVAARTTPAARPYVVLAAIGVAAMPVAIVVHNVAGALTGGEEGVSFIVALTIAPICIAIGTLGAGMALLRERHDLGIGVLLAGIGMTVFGLYNVFAMIDDDRAAPFAIIVVPATIAVVLGVIWSPIAILREGR